MFFKAIVEKRMDQPLLEVVPLSGGDINRVYKLRFPDATCVLKLNAKDRFPGMFEKEAKGLGLIASTGCRTPEVLKTFTEGEHQYLILEYILEQGRGPDYWERFGRRLAGLHKHTSKGFGLEEDNYIGSLEQINSKREKWTDFFIECRLSPLMARASDKNLLSREHQNSFERLFSRLPELIPEEEGSLLHGDLWSGNLMCGGGGEPVFIDPAVYFGNREADIAMTQLFGGFDRRFLDSYNESYQLLSGWEERIELHNLYPRLVHLVLFGSSYLSGISHTLRRFGQG